VAAWTKRDDETALAYSAFTAYYLLPVRERSIDAAYLRANPDQTQIGGRAKWSWFQWSTKHDWVARAAAYDTHLAEQDRLLWEERRRQLKQADWDDGDAMRQLTRDALPHARQFIHQQRTVIPARDGQPEQVIVTLSFDVVGLSRVLAEASKLQRLATGESTDNVQLSGAALDAFIARQLVRLANAGQASDGGAPDDDEAEFNDLAADGDGEVPS
jgi:hypothetical protein